MVCIFIKGINIIIIKNNVIAWTIPAIGVLPPFLIFAAVLAIAPVAGIPPNNEDAIFAIPCPINSVFELCFLSIIPSATTADNKDSIAPKNAIVTAGINRTFILSIVSDGNCGDGIADDISPNAPPIVCTFKLNPATISVETINAISDPGIVYLF